MERYQPDPPVTRDSVPGIPAPDVSTASAVAPTPTVLPVPSLPQMWLTPGPYLPRRTWQRQTRTLLTALTGVSGVLWVLAAIGVILIGFVVARYAQTATFAGGGGVIVNCSSSTTADGEVAAGAPVVAWSDRSDKVLRTTLQPAKETDLVDAAHRDQGAVKRCYLPFTLEGVRSDAAGYNIRIGDTAPQFVTTRSLKQGAIVPLVIGGDR